MSRKKIVLGIVIDYTKAFDRINHDILFQKLELYRIRGHALLIRSYLSSRTQYVQINKFKLSLRHVVCSVPQGSILGPLLFNIYINDIVTTDTVARFIIYADGTSTFTSSENYNNVSTQANNLLLNLEKWSDTNVLSVNVSKSKAIIFHPKNKPIKVIANLVYQSSVIEIVPSFKLLGVYFSENMQWDDHINHILLKTSQVVGLLLRHRSILPQKVKLILYNSLFCSYLNYCTLVWATTTK